MIAATHEHALSGTKPLIFEIYISTKIHYHKINLWCTIMATNEEVLRSFLIALNWKNEAHQQKEFVGAIESATLKANLLADGIRSMAESIAGSLSKASDNFLQLGVLASQTRTSASAILALEQAFAKFGVSAGTVDSVILNVNTKMRAMNDGNLSYMEKFGFSIDKTTGKLVTDFTKAKKELDRISDNGRYPAAITQFADKAGMPQPFAQIIEQFGPQLDAFKKKAEESNAAFGIDQNMVNTQTEYQRKLQQVYTDLDNTWKDFTTALEAPLTPQLEKLDKWFQDNAPEIRKSAEDIGKAFKDGIIDPLVLIGTDTDGLKSNSDKIKDFKDSVVASLDVVKGVLDTVRAVYALVDDVSSLSQKIRQLAWRENRNAHRR